MKCIGELKTLDSDGRRTLVMLELLTNPANVERYVGQRIDVSLDTHRDSRSLQANKFFWACVQDICNATFEDKDKVYLDLLRHYGQYTVVRIPKEALDLLKRQWRETEVITEVDGMVDVFCYFGSHTYNASEFARLLEGVKDTMRNAGLEPPPDERMKAIIEGLKNDN